MKMLRFALHALFAVACAVVLCLPARAWNLEGGMGFSQTQRQPNGTWYQEGFPYALDLRKSSWFMGVREQITPTISAHVAYVSFGILHADAIATPVDANYNPATHSCIGPCVAQSRFVGSGRSDGLKIAAEWRPDGDGFGLIGGLFLFRPRWHTTVYNWTPAYDVPPRTIEHSIKQRWTIRPVIGVAYQNDNWTIRLEQYFNKPYDSTNTGIAKSTTMLSLGFSF